MKADATKCFDFVTIRLVNSSFSTSQDLDQIELNSDTTYAEARKWVVPDVRADESDARLLATVNFGLRLCRNRPPETEGSTSDEESLGSLVLYTIEAAFVTEFRIKDPCDQRDFEEFVQANTLHLAWPFWRAHIFAILREASLPLVEVPMLAAIKKKAKQQIEHTAHSSE